MYKKKPAGQMDNKMDTPLHRSNRLEDNAHSQLAHEILRALQEIRFGSVEVVIHDSKVVQIERKEKIRIDADSSRVTKGAS